MNPKFALQQFLEEKVAAAPTGSLLADVQVRAAKGETSKKPHTVALVSGEFSLSPSGPNGALQYYDAELYPVVFVRIPGQQPNAPAARATAESQLDELVRTIAGLIFEDNTLGGRVFDARVFGCRFEDEGKTGEQYLIATLTILANEASRPVENR